VVFLLVRDRLRFDAGLIASAPPAVNVVSNDVEEP
jgi:hypothetical protein